MAPSSSWPQSAAALDAIVGSIQRLGLEVEQWRGAPSAAEPKADDRLAHQNRLYVFLVPKNG